MKEKTDNMGKLNALFNLLAGVFFLLAAFNVITGGGAVNIAYLVLGILFLAIGLWTFVARARR